MAAGTAYSDNLTALIANPISILNKRNAWKRVLIDEIEVAITNIDDVGDIILFGPLPSNSIVTSIKLFSDDLDSNGTPALAFNVGLYYGRNNYVSGVLKTEASVISANCIATAIIVGQAATTDVTNVGKVGYEVRFEAADIDTIDKELWELGGLSKDCGGTVYLGLTVSTAAATAAAGGLKAVIEYI